MEKMWATVVMLIGLLISYSTGYVYADDKNSPVILDTINVLGGSNAVREIPGSAHYIGTPQIRQQSYSDVNQILARIPGVYLRQEDGFGLFPNISLRGVDTTRSAKVTVMEDGIFTAPAPYSAPAAYYSPAAGRMSAIEVLKGSSQIKYGPHITGGVINYIATPIPDDGKVYLRSIYGSYEEWRNHGFAGDTLDTEFGRFGYLVEGFFRHTNGFKKIDSTAGFSDRNNTGFEQIEPMVKLSWEPSTDWYQRFEARFGYSNTDADETYLGLSGEDFKDDPFRRYASTRFDNINLEHYRSYLRHYIVPTDDWNIVTTVYYNKFRRNWRKLHDVRIPADGNLSLSSALAGVGNGLSCLRGQLDCTLRVRNNNREYYLWGMESIANYRFDALSGSHDVNFGFRYHEDEVKRFQRDERFSQNASGVITASDPGVPGDAGNREQHTDVYSFFLQDRFEFGSWGIAPGVRYEHLDQSFNDKNSREKGSGQLDLYAGGVSIDYQFNPEWLGFAGIFRGFSPPSPRSAIRDKLQEETSIAYEAGLRFTGLHGALTADVVGFLSQFDNLIVIDNIGGAGNDRTENFGEVEAHGVEFSVNFDAGDAFKLGFSNPYFLSFTYTNAEQRNDAQSTDPESIFSFGDTGNKVPYIPEYAVSFGSGLKFANWNIDFTARYVDETFTSANNVSDQVNGEGNPDARFGKTDDYFIVDIAGSLQLATGVNLLVGVQNLFDERYLASRQPHGPRPGQPRFIYGGFEVEFDI